MADNNDQAHAHAREMRWNDVVDALCKVVGAGCAVLDTISKPDVQAVLHHVGKILGLGFVDAAATLHRNALIGVRPMNELDELAELHRLSGEYLSALVALKGDPDTMLAVAALSEQQRGLFFQDLADLVVQRAQAYASLNFSDMVSVVLERTRLSAVTRGD